MKATAVWWTDVTSMKFVTFAFRKPAVCLDLYTFCSGRLVRNYTTSLLWHC